MSEHEFELFEADLQRLKPAKAPEDFVARLARTAQPKAADAADCASRASLREVGPRRTAASYRGFFSRIGAPWRPPRWVAAPPAAAPVPRPAGGLALCPPPRPPRR